MRRLRRARIVATLGPASSSPEMIRTLFESGVDVFRLNFSHGSHEDHRARFNAIRALEAEVHAADATEQRSRRQRHHGRQPLSTRPCARL